MPVVPNPSITEAVTALGARLDALEGRLRALQDLTQEIRLLLGTSATTLPDGRLLVQTLHGVKYFIDPDDRVMAPQLIVYRQWEADLSAFFRHALTPDSQVVDVGAGFGYFTCLAGALIGNSGRGQVWAVEPNPAMTALLSDNIAINWSMAPIELQRAAAGAQAGEGRLSVHPKRAANASLSPTEDGEEISVPIVRLDDVVPPDVAVDLMKIDVEGHEAGVLEGARGIIGRSPGIVIIMEWSLSQMEAAGTNAEAMLDLIAGLGLEAFALGPRPDWREAVRLSPEALTAISYGNIVLRRIPPNP